MNIPEDVSREIAALEGEIKRLREGSWDHAESAVAGRNLRSQAESVVLAAKKVKEVVTQNTYSPR
jgi:hypothetical protein